MSTPISTTFEFVSPVSPVEADAHYQLVKRNDIDVNEVEDHTTSTVEVTVLWERSVLHVSHLRDTQSFSLTDQDTLNDGTRFVVDGAILGASEAQVVARDAHGIRFIFAAGAQGEVEIDGSRRSLSQLVLDGIATPSMHVPGHFEVGMIRDGRYRVEVGGVSVQAKLVAAGRVAKNVSRRDPMLRGAGVLSALAVAAFLGAMRMAASDGGYISGDDHDARMSELRDFLARQSERVIETPETHEAAAVDGTAGAAHAGSAGSMGDRRTQQQNHRTASIQRAETPRIGRTPTTRETVTTRGIFAALGGAAALTDASHTINSPWGAMTTTTGVDSRDAVGNINGADLGDSQGTGGLDTLSTGVGGGGHEQGIGTGPLGTIGRGNCPPGQDCRYGLNHGVIRSSGRETHGPRLTTATPDVQGAMSPDSIRRVVLRNIGQINHCYEQGLAVNPNASGRVVVRFVIGSDGTVLAAAVASDSLGMPVVSQCMSNAVRRWSFPAPATVGTVNVSYPFNLMPAE
jgi:hypothetical protein